MKVWTPDDLSQLFSLSIVSIILSVNPNPPKIDSAENAQI